MELNGGNVCFAASAAAAGRAAESDVTDYGAYMADLVVPQIDGFKTKLIKSSSESVTFLIDIRNEDDITKWLQKFYELTASKFNVKKSAKLPNKRGQYFLSLICHHGSRDRRDKRKNRAHKTKTG